MHVCWTVSSCERTEYWCVMLSFRIQGHDQAQCIVTGMICHSYGRPEPIDTFGWAAGWASCYLWNLCPLILQCSDAVDWMRIMRGRASCYSTHYYQGQLANPGSPEKLPKLCVWPKLNKANMKAQAWFNMTNATSVCCLLKNHASV